MAYNELERALARTRASKAYNEPERSWARTQWPGPQKAYNELFHISIFEVDKENGASVDNKSNGDKKETEEYKPE